MAKKSVTKGEICFYPKFRADEQGGVATYVRTLTEKLTKCGWTVVDQPHDETIIHTNAMARAERINIFTCHGVYPMHDKMPAWQRKANNARGAIQWLMETISAGDNALRQLEEE